MAKNISIYKMVRGQRAIPNVNAFWNSLWIVVLILRKGFIRKMN